MAEYYSAKIKVVSQTGTCGHGHKVGDEWITSGKTPEGVCLSAFNSLCPRLQVLMYGGSAPWQEGEATTIACPDAANPVVFELRRLPY